MIPIQRVPVDTTIVSPCVRKCCLNETDVCLGCGRLLAEITGWMEFTAEEKRAGIATASERLNLLRKQWGEL
jgi:uncharacterized protein